MSDNGSNMQPVRPLTRREMREREQAAAAERSGQGAPPPPAPAPGAGGWQQPARPAAPSGPPPSRRTLRETTGPADHPPQPSVVRPPAASGGMRGLDETGRLTPVQETAERVAIRPPAPTPVVPTRTSSRPPAGAPRPSVPGAPGPVRPATPSAPVGGLGAGAARPEPTQPPRLSAFSAPPTSPAPPGTPAPAPAPSPWGGTPAPAPERTPAPAPPAEAAGAALPWSAITAGSAPEPASAAPQTSPFGGVRETAPAPAGGSDELFPRVRGRAAEPEESDDDDLEDERRGPSYTWLHYLILVAVAFVLGLLVWTLVSRDDPGLAVEDASASAAAVRTWDDPGTLDTGR
ncbi:hypothetical protein [Cellulosimicrobium sp. 4261]|uniref:hypothetical protein n=1 Tax=Cellulosimicrobium sp. 4261 TaxID=3156458 RepID=UPI0033939BFC